MWTLEKFIWPKIEHETTTKPITLHTVTNFKRDCHGGHLSASMQASVLPVLHCQATWHSWLTWCIVGQYTSDQAFCPHGMIPRVLAMSLHVLSYLLIVPSKILELVLRYGDYAGRCQVSAHNHPTALINWNSGWFRSGAVLTRIDTAIDWWCKRLWVFYSYDRRLFRAHRVISQWPHYLYFVIALFKNSLQQRTRNRR